MDPNQSPAPAAPSRLTIGLRQGIRCYFDVDDITISVWCSGLTGREIVSVDDRVVSDRINWRRRSRHAFEHAGVAYTIDVIIESVWSYRCRIELHRNGKWIDADSAEYIGPAGKRGLPLAFGVGLLFDLGFAFGVFLARTL